MPKACPSCHTRLATTGWPVARCIYCHLADAELSMAVHAILYGTGKFQEWGRKQTCDLYWKDEFDYSHPVLPGLEIAR